MSTRPLMRFITAPSTRVVVRTTLFVLYYLLIIAGLLILYGRGDFSTPPFVYQGF